MARPSPAGGRALPTVFIRFLFVLVLLAAPLARAADKQDYAQSLGDAQAALAAGDYATAYQRYLQAADTNPLAQFTVALFHENGWGRPRDHEAACNWYARAAAHHIPAAMHFTAECLMRTPDKPGNAEQAFQLYLDAAKAGHFISLCNAGEQLIRGKGVKKDVQQGLALCTQAAQANSPPAMLGMGNYLRDDPDVPRNLPAAREWYRNAAERNMAEAQYKLAIMLAQGEGGAPDLDQALRWMEQAAAGGYVPAYLPTAVLYANLAPEKETGQPGAAHLAKVYLWSSAAKARLADPALREQAGKLLAQAVALMPAAWRPELDRKVAEHLAKFDQKKNS